MHPTVSSAIDFPPAYHTASAGFDGISILGGEPFLQPDGLWALVQELRARGCFHILVYSGYTYNSG
ncbi:MAG TPA: 4Fe-4S cluster-binding domain-containing protein [Chloroflexota bacterium]